MKISERLLKSRGGKSLQIGCPVYISETACRKLFDEAGVSPTPKCVGMMGDVLENFALLLLESWKGRRITESEFVRTISEFKD